ncbi:MAG: acyl-CoA synthetase FdrA [Anaerolineae bacterium]|nr:acyl-CoA synthetase FdrA [Anaerolineae bacterium]
MMTIMQYEIRPGAYYDSVVLMELQRSLAALPEVIDAGVVMATPANKELLLSTELWPETVTSVTPDDLLIVVKAETEQAAVAAIAQVDELLKRRHSTASQSFRPRSLDSAAKALPEAEWVLVSVPGRYAAGVAKEALSLNKHVFLYSDNVSVADEVALKQQAQEKGLLVMGPDCGTAVINGIGLGFANRIRRGKIGLVAASGTGLQAVSSHIHQLGGGVSQAIGTGGRDLKPEIGGATTRQGLDLLARDDETAVIVLISKPPAREVATQLLAAAQAIAKPVIINFIGYPPPARQLGNLHFANNAWETAVLAVQLASQSSDTSPHPPRSTSARLSTSPRLNGFLRGLFSGGTLAYETMLGLQTVLSPLYSNGPIRPEQTLADPLVSQAHTILDMGADEFTQGRLHPMMDNDLRIRRLRQEAADPEVSLILLDVVLGEGSHPDPASELAPVIAEIVGQSPLSLSQGAKRVAVILIGTDEDPQGMAVQTEKLMAAGAEVFTDTTSAVTMISQRLQQSPPAIANPIDLEAFRSPLAAINVGLDSFYDSLVGQGASATQVEWRPPAGGNEKMMALLAKMKQK